MSDWKVSRERIELHPHYNAETLELAKLGNRQFVVKKGLYQNGDTVITIPEKSILPDNIAESFLSYLRKGNIVGSTKLRGEFSEGVLIPDQPMLGAIGENIAEKLGIKFYEPPIPSSMLGDVKPLTISMYHHDCEHLGINSEKLADHAVIITEKLHGSQINILIENNVVEVTSKGLGKKGLRLEASKSNLYHRAFDNFVGESGFNSLIQDYFLTTDTIQMIGEVLPCQKGFTYGFKKPTIRLFKFVVNKRVLPLDEVPFGLKKFWVPILYRGKFDTKIAVDLANKGKSTLHHETIKEGVVLSLAENPDLSLKFISDAYAKKATGDEFN